MTEWHPLRPLNENHGNESESLALSLWKELDKHAEDRGRAIANTSPAKVPTLDHSCMADYGNVYEPSDDTYLLLDAMKYDLFSGYPADNTTGTGERCEESSESVDRTALELYHQHLRIHKSDNRNQKEISVEDQDDDGTFIHGIVEKEGYDASLSIKIASRLLQLRRLEQIRAVMEIGTGSGVPITYLSKRLLMEKPNCISNSDDNCDDDEDDDNKFAVIATDLNPLALEFAQRTAKENGVAMDDKAAVPRMRKIDFVECDLATPLLETLKGTIDVLVFNPPYVPTEDSEIRGNGIEISWAGGENGRRVIDLALPQIAALLRKPDGVCYMITVDDNLPPQLASILKKDHGLQMIPLVRRRARNEYLSVQKISWSLL
mmetsp:Transcript_382/g.777  ORF Transcript_382/g.777 Transcript_382/m.777 type:complete len:376 (+) Transcript_382:180-1307(+)